MEFEKIRNLSDDELKSEQAKAGEQLFRIRFQKSLGNNDGIKKLRTLKLDIARIKVKAYPAREVQGNLWVYMGEDPAAGAAARCIGCPPNQTATGRRPFSIISATVRAATGLVPGSSSTRPGTSTE